ncbi:MAG: ferredoxin [Ilumatobacteraceae bacterium]|jgi:ferredoxin
MRVWIDQDECSGVGVCVDDCPQVFTLGSDGIAYVVVEGRVYGSNEPATVNDALLEQVLDAAEGCPEECIYIEAG